ncbi:MULTISPECIES: (d)CMP kinase [unclassified Pseudonocardia]|uniref:(d)CMP kinase n=1 Tax=unclassified Pseudonocardia TaxID=2619320 RepID=UPI000525346A|nr:MULTISPECIES: (d)CMP kinase [unclassified Pseudonocardia]ALE76299.1 cytidylate kinase [Pseudonocardia sp. EC080625-04]ALL78972.1 cytidylate kinase [Pseudonocardia sp. EC080610-09]ALL84145.1 cytidylate kinase [Pseudonocardia sp. EC080619-01]
MDGPSGTGKSTVSRRLAQACSAAYLDTGAMYRAATLAALRAGLTEDTPVEEIARVATGARMESGTDPAAPSITLDGEDVSADIRGPEVTGFVSAVSAVPEVRAELVARQHALIRAATGDGGGIVVEGRDIGTVVVPDAPLKVYLTASPEVRAARRGRQDARAGRESDLHVTLADVERRDRLDSSRRISPLYAAADALVLDTDRLSADSVLERLRELVAERGLVG